MDDPSQKGRRSSILKLRQGDVTVENTDDVDDEQKQVFKRRVSFHNVKTVQTFDENNLNLLDGSPIREKIQETMSSDGVLTPGRSHIPTSTPRKPHGHNDVMDISFMSSTMTDGVVPILCRHEKTSYSTCDMSLENEISSDIQGEFSPLMDDQTVDMSISTDPTSADLPGLTPTINCTTFEEYETLRIIRTQHGRHTPVSNTLHCSRSSVITTSTSLLGDDTARVFEEVLCRNQIEENVDSFCSKSAELPDATNYFEQEMPKSDNEKIGSACDQSGRPATGSRMDMSMSLAVTTLENIQEQVIGETSKISATADKMMISVQCVQSEDGNNSIRENKQDTDIRMEEGDNEDANATEKNYWQFYYSTNETHNEATITKRDISVMPIGSRFQLTSPSKDDSVLSAQSLLEMTSYLKRMMFNTQSMQVNYVNPANNQPQSNCFREEILEKLRSKILEIEQSSSSKVDLLLPKLQATCPKKALALKKMDVTALELEDVDIFHCACLRGEIEWAQFRLEVAQKARSALQQLLTKDESNLQTLREDAQLCCSKDELQRDVEKLQAELAGLPSADEIAEIINSHKKFVEEEEKLDDRILDLEIKEMRMEVQLARARNKELKEIIEKLDDMAKTYQRNRERVRASTQQSHDSHR